MAAGRQPCDASLPSCWSPRPSRWRGRRWTPPGSSASTRAAGIPRSSPSSRRCPAWRPSRCWTCGSCWRCLRSLWSGWRVVARAVWHASSRGRARAGARRGRRRGRLHRAFSACWGLNYRRQPITEGLDFDRARVTAGRSRCGEPSRGGRAQSPASDRARRSADDADAGGHAGAAGAGLRGRAARAGRDAAGDGGAPEDLDAVAVLPLGDGGRDGEPAGPRGDREPRGAASGAAVRDRARVGPPGRLGPRKRGQLCRLAHLSCRRCRRARTADGSRSTGICAATLPRDRLRRSTPCFRPDRGATWRPLPRDCDAAQPLVQRASWRTYDQFLKANRVDEGVKSYDEVVTLVLGTAPTPTAARAVASPASSFRSRSTASWTHPAPMARRIGRVDGSSNAMNATLYDKVNSQDCECCTFITTLCYNPSVRSRQAVTPWLPRRHSRVWVTGLPWLQFSGSTGQTGSWPATGRATGRRRTGKAGRT